MSTNLELYLLKSFFSYDFFMQHREGLDAAFLKQNSPEIYRIFITIGLFHERFPSKSITSVEELEVFHQSQFPSTSKRGVEELGLLYKRLGAIVTDEDIAVEYFEEHSKRTKAAKIAFLGLEVAEGKKTFDDLLGEAETLRQDSRQGNYSEFLSDDSEAILAKIKAPGLRWRLDSMNQMLGPLRKGDFGFIFARPESGKTTFLADQVTYMAEQECGPILWFNNEKAGEVVLARCQQACFGLTSQELFSDYELLAGNIHIYDHA